MLGVLLQLLVFMGGGSGGHPKQVSMWSCCVTPPPQPCASAGPAIPEDSQEPSRKWSDSSLWIEHGWLPDLGLRCLLAAVQKRQTTWRNKWSPCETIDLRTRAVHCVRCRGSLGLPMLVMLPISRTVEILLKDQGRGATERA